jgi:hypothetical protein
VQLFPGANRNAALPPERSDTIAGLAEKLGLDLTKLGRIVGVKVAESLTESAAATVWGPPSARCLGVRRGSIRKLDQEGR